MKKCESLKIFVLGFLVYFVSVSAFLAQEAKWFGKIKKSDERPKILRYKFWKSVWLIIVVFAFILAVQCFFLNADFTGKHWSQVAAAFIALVAALGRGGPGIESIDKCTAIEKIDYGMFAISQLGATSILLFVLIL